MGLIPTFRGTSGLKNPERWLKDLFGGGSVSESGVQVDSDSMMSESAVWCAINFIASNIAGLPCPVLKIKGRQKEKARDHALFKLLNSQANDEMIAMVYRETMLYHLLLWGVHYSIQVRDRLNRIVALWPVHPDNVRVERIGKTLTYHITMSNGDEEPYSRKEILHIPALSPNGLFGNSMLEYSKDSIGLMLAMRSFANLFFANGSNMGVIFEHPGQLGEVAHTNLTKSLATAMAGLGKSHKAFVAEEGMKVSTVGSNPADSQLIEGRSFQISDVARWFNLPPHILKELSRSTNNNIEHQGIEVVKYSFRVWIIRIEQSLEAWCLSESEKKDYIIRHNVEGLLRGDSAARAEYYKTQFNTASITPNEIRELEDRNPIEENWADEPYIMINMMPLSQAGQMNVPENNEPAKTETNQRSLENRDINTTIAGRKRVQARFSPLIKEAAQKLVDRETNAIKRESKKQGSQRSTEDMEIWLNNFYRDFGKYIDNGLAPILRAYAESIQEAVSSEIGVDPVMSDELQKEINNYIDGFRTQYIDSSKGQMLQQLQIGLEEIDKRADEWQEKRADKVALSERNGLSNMVAAFVFTSSGFPAVWRNVGVTCPFCQTMSGKKVNGFGTPFLEKDTTIDVGGDHPPMKVRTTKYPPLHNGCDCVISAR